MQSFLVYMASSTLGVRFEAIATQRPLEVARSHWVGCRRSPISYELRFSAI